MSAILFTTLLLYKGDLLTYMSWVVLGIAILSVTELYTVQVSFVLPYRYSCCGGGAIRTSTHSRNSTSRSPSDASAVLSKRHITRNAASKGAILVRSLPIIVVALEI